MHIKIRCLLTLFIEYLFAFVLLIIFTTTALYAQDIRSDVSGFSLQLNANYTQWNTSGQFLEAIRDHDPNGYSFQIMAGYGFNQRMEGFFTISNSDFNMSGDWSTYTHTEIGVGMRFNFGVTLSEFRPFAEVQLNGSSVEIDEIFVNSGTSRSVGKLSMSGLSAVAGGGTRYFFSSRAAASLHAKIHFGMNYDLELAGRSLDVNEDQDFNQWELGTGFTWYFGRRY